MSPRQSKTGSRSTRRARAGRGSKSGGRGSASSRSLSASRSKESNTRRASSAGRSAATRHASSGRRPSKAARATSAGRSRRADSSASYAVKLLKQDHRAVAQAIEEFESAQREEKQAIARRICKMLTVHAQIEEELLYPAARDVLDSDDAHLVAEARVEHASVKDLIRQIEDREQLDEQYEAKVQVLGEYVKHHVGEEETELFPRLERTSLDLQSLGERLEQRKRELMGEEGEGLEGHEEEEESSMPTGRSRGSRGHRPSPLHARRR
jgi:hemerythrin superfamily protein